MKYNNRFIPITLIRFAIALSLFSACKKDNNNSPSNGSTSPSAYLTAAPWKYSKLEFQMQDSSWYNATPLPNDVTGISISFNGDGTYNDAGGFFPHTGTWKLSADGKTLTIMQSITYGTISPSNIFKVTTLNNSTLQITTTENPFTVPIDPNTYYFGERNTFSH